jgi:hypothetical protein
MIAKRSYIYKEINIFCAQNNMSINDIAKKFRVSVKFLYAVLSYKKQCPKNMIKKISNLLNLPEEEVGIAFGYYTWPWVVFCRHHPDLVRKELSLLLEKTNEFRKDINWSSTYKFKSL